MLIKQFMFSFKILLWHYFEYIYLIIQLKDICNKFLSHYLRNIWNKMLNTKWTCICAAFYSERQRKFILSLLFELMKIAIMLLWLCYCYFYYLELYWKNKIYSWILFLLFYYNSTIFFFLLFECAKIYSILLVKILSLILYFLCM